MLPLRLSLSLATVRTGFSIEVGTAAVLAGLSVRDCTSDLGLLSAGVKAGLKLVGELIVDSNLSVADIACKRSADDTARKRSADAGARKRSEEGTGRNRSRDERERRRSDEGCEDNDEVRVVERTLALFVVPVVDGDEDRWFAS